MLHIKPAGQAPDSRLSFEVAGDGDVVLVAFGGIASRLGIPPFEFFRMTEALPTTRLFIRDLSQCWYHGSLPGIGHGVADLRAFLESFFARLNPSRVVFFGNSMGGYAAMLLGRLIQIDRVIAFSPQTFISPELRLRHADTRWARQMQAVHRCDASAAQYFDLAAVLEAAPARTPIEIHVAAGDRLDQAHASHVRGMAGVSVSDYECEGHGLVRKLREQGRLGEIIAQALGGARAA